MIRKKDLRQTLIKAEFVEGGTGGAGACGGDEAKVTSSDGRRVGLPGIGVPVAGGLKATLLGALMPCSTVELRHADLTEPALYYGADSTGQRMIKRSLSRSGLEFLWKS